MGMTVEGECPGGVADHGNPSARAGEFEPYRAYLTLVARRSIGPALAGKVGVSDLVQETFLLAQRQAGTFRGQTGAQWRAWLKSILLHHLANQRRYHAIRARRGAQDTPGRDVPTEAAAITPPSRQLMRRERDVALGEAMERLPEHYRRVIAWHHHERLTFIEIARRMGISDDAAQKLWGRALVRLREILGPEHDPR